jgi:hypothetical protein
VAKPLEKEMKARELEAGELNGRISIAIKRPPFELPAILTQ